jgi:hypothetical protein
MSITLREGLGRNLTANEVDANFVFLSGSYVLNSFTSSMTSGNADSSSVAARATTLSAAATASFSDISTLSRGGSGSFSGSYQGDGSNLTGLPSFQVANSTNNRVITSVDSTNGNAEANLTFDGSTLTVAGAISETSALRYKENIQPLSNSLNKVIQLNPVEYDWKNDGRHDIGLIAEEVNKVYPDLVSKQGKKVQGISYSRLTATLIGAIQELNNQNQILQNRIKTIEENKKN